MSVRVLALVVAVMPLAGGCATVDESANTPPSIAVDVIQGRTDRDSRTIVLDVTNTSERPIQLVRATLSTGQFASDAVWSRGTSLGAGRTVSLRAPLGKPVCPAPADAAPLVAVSYLDADGATRIETVVPTQSTDVLSIVERDDCIAVLTAEIADLAVSESLEWTPGARRPATLRIVATPMGAGSLEIVEARSTILLQIVDAAGDRVASRPVGITIDERSGQQVLPIELVPTRCDPHAIAEDKRGTIMVLSVKLDDGTAGVVYVRSSDGVKAELYAFVTDYCT